MILNVKGGSSDRASLPYEATPNRKISASMKATKDRCSRAQEERLKEPCAEEESCACADCGPVAAASVMT
jgi:hypothetical protein